MEATAVTIDNHPMWVNLEPAYQVLEGYPEAELDRKVFACIAGYANSQGVCDPLQKTIANKIGEIKMNVNRSVHRLIGKNLIKVPRKEKKYKDIHPRNIYQFNKDFLRQDPDTRSSHFDAEKWKTVAARLKKYVSKAVDQVKKVAVTAAENMSARKRKPRAHGNRAWNQSYQRPSYSYENMKAAHPPVCTGEKEHDGPNLVDGRIQDMLFKKGISAMDPAFLKVGPYMLDRLTEKSKPEDYDAMFKQACDKFHITNTTGSKQSPMMDWGTVFPKVD